MNKEAIFKTLLDLLNKLADDWEYPGEITSDTWLVADLGLESIDVVVLGTTLQNQFKQPLPFAEFLADIGRREIRDIRVSELVDFISDNLGTPPSS